VPLPSYRSLLFKFRTLRFPATLWGLRDNVRCSSCAHWKARSKLPINVNWTLFAGCYGWVATSEKRSKIYDFAPTRWVWSKISGRRGCPAPIVFARLVRPINALQLCCWQFSHKETLQQNFFKGSAIFYGNRPSCVFETPLGDLGATYDDHLRLIGKRVVYVLLALIELFSLGVTAEALRAIICSKSAILLQRGPFDPKFQVEGVAPTNHSSSQ